MATNFTLSHEVIVKANGEHISKNSKQVICIETGEVWYSVGDTAKTLGATPSNMSRAINSPTKKYKGKHYILAKDYYTALPMMLGQIQSNNRDAEDAQKWREYQAKLDAERKAKEAIKASIAKAEEKVARRERINQKALEEARKADEMLARAEQELYELLKQAKELGVM